MIRRPVAQVRVLKLARVHPDAVRVGWKDVIRNARRAG